MSAVKQRYLGEAPDIIKTIDAMYGCEDESGPHL